MTHARRIWDSRAGTKRATAALSIAFLMAGVLGIAGTIVVPTQAQAAAPISPRMAPGNAGTPSDPIVLFEEDFESVSGTAPVGLAAYTGASGQRYTADAGWLQNCNGQIVNFNIPYTSQGNCASAVSSANLRQLTYALGAHAGATDPNANDAVAAYTEGDPGANAVEFATVDAIPLASASGRFLTFSVDTAAKNCDVSPPRYQFSFVSEAGTATPVGGQLNACTSSQTVPVERVGDVGATSVRVGTYTSNGSVLFNAASLGIRMVNANGGGGGNDAAFDNIRVLDVTPQLDKSFSPTSLYVGGSSTLTFTVTNTSELAAKAGWSFTDALPTGLTVAAQPNIGGTCVADTTAAPGASTIAIADGNLAAGQAFCTITVDVTSETAAAYVNGPDNVTTVGLNGPGEAPVEFREQQAFSCTSNAPGLLYQDIPGSVSTIDLVTGEYETQENIFPRNINATGFNVLDGYVYGYTTTTEPYEMVRVGSDGSVQSLGQVPGIDTTFHVGDVDVDGHYWVANTTEWYEIDLVPGSPTYMTVLNSGALVFPPDVPGIADWAAVPGGGDYLYAVGTDAGGTGVLVRFDLALHTLENVASLDVPISAVGAVYADADGFLYSSSNADGRINRIDIQDETATLFAEGPASAQNDGARCATSPILLDFGDAPDSYRTMLASDGPRHGIQGLAAGGTTAPLMLGGSVDAETDGAPTADADAAADDNGVADPIVVTFGEETVVAVTATNDTDEAATLAGWIDLNGSDTFDAGELVETEVPANSGTAEYRLRFPVGTTTEETFARFRIFAADVTDIVPTGAVSAGEVEDYAVAVIERALDIEKTSTLTGESRPGDRVTYTVTATNTGTAPYTDADPAVVFDDLSGVLDDAGYNDDATAVASDGSDVAAPAFLEPSHLSWAGALASGESVTITYTVTLNGDGDGVARNVAWAPGTPPPPGEVPPTPACDPADADGDDPVTGEPCAAVDGELPRLSVEKTSDTVDLPADGGVVTYEVTITNAGPGVYTEGAPATVTDDLSEVLDDATFDGIIAPASGAVFNEDAQELTWSGPLGVGESVTVSYSVTYDETTGDNVLLNVACVPADEAAPGADPCSQVRIPAAALDVTKTVDPEDGTTVAAGQEVTYTISFDSVGQIPAAVDHVDDLSDVLDDATLVDGSITTSNPALTATLNGDQLAMTGEVPNGSTYTVSYTVIVASYADQGDHVLGNVVTRADGTCGTGECPSTENPVRHLSVTKSADSVSDVLPADVVGYTVTVTNDGEGDYTEDVPAAIADDMTDVLDDAAYNGDVAAVASDGSDVPAPTVGDGILGWSGPLAAGESVTITYSVTVTNLGDNDLVNTVAVLCGAGEICDPPTPPVEIVLPHVVPSKTSDPASGGDVAAGDVVTYTLSWTNDGKAAGPLDATDDLAEALDDAELTSLPVVDDAHAESVTAVFDIEAQTIRVTGELAVGETVTVTYQVTVRADGERGDNVLANVVTSDVPPFVPDPSCEGADCPVPFDPPTTEHLIPEIVGTKSVDPASSTAVRAGQELTYTLTFRNEGTAPGPVDRVDDLVHVLDDADVTVAPVASGEALVVSEIADGRFAVTGELAPDQTVTVVYAATVKASDKLGDGQLANFLLDPNTPTPAEPVCAEGEDCTFNPISDVAVSKTADPTDGTEVQQGQEVTYTLTFANAGRGAEVIDYTDHMGGVLDDADLTTAPAASDDALTVGKLSDGAFSIAGELGAGQTVTVTYSVTVRDWTAQGDHALGNVVAVTGQQPATACAGGSALCTNHPVGESDGTPPLAATGGVITGGVIGGALLLLIAGGLLLIVRRRRGVVDAAQG